LLPDYIYHIVIITILLMLLFSYFLIGLVVQMRVVSHYRNKQKIKFLNKWERLLFSYLDGGVLPEEIVNIIPRRKYKYLLEYIGEYLQALKGDEFNKLAALITSTNISDYLLKKLRSNNKGNITSSAFFIGIAKIEKAETILQMKIKKHNEQIYFSCSTALARINSYDSLGIILTEFKRYKHYGYLLLILTEYDENICREIIELLKSELPEQLIVTFIRVLRYYKYQNGGPAVLTLLVYSYSKEIMIECMKFIEEIKYKNAVSAVSRLIEHSKPEIRSQAIRTIMILDGETFEEKAYSKLFDN
jgi:hypothetical protein